MFFIFLSVIAGLNLGTVRKAEDPIRDTQTNPILYEQKKEEEKDGKKGPLMYHVKNNPREAFFIDPPFESIKKDAGAVRGQEASQDIADWWEEQPASPEDVKDSSQNVAPGEEPVWEEDLAKSEAPPAGVDVEGAAPGAEPGDSSQDKNADYWW